MPPWSLARHLPVLTGAAALALFAAAPTLAGAQTVSVSGELVRYGAVVPAGAGATVTARYDAVGDSRFTLSVTGLRPHQEYGAHVHVHACGADPSAAGPDFQQVPNPDPRKAPHDREFENRVNEIWFHLETDEAGNAVATTTQPWQFSPQRRAGSVIIHAERTHVGPDGPAGTAGPRVACLTVGL